MAESPAETAAAEWDAEASGWDENPGVVAYSENALRTLRAELLRRRKTANSTDQETSWLVGARVLDFGCGTGLLTALMAREGAKEVVGIDVSPKMVSVLAEKRIANVTPLAGPLSEHIQPAAKEGTLVPGTFDLVTASSVCSFLGEELDSTVKQLVQLLRPGGLWLQWDWEDAGSGHGLKRDDVRRLLGEAGLEDVEVETGFEAQFGEEIMKPLMGSGVRSAT
jgi:2-polyprenyl-3-methyl-5-hydroxy-6-metoxy-1,4-benzoquinol methylase